jgi:hypothetical protein
MRYGRISGDGEVHVEPNTRVARSYWLSGNLSWFLHDIYHLASALMREFHECILIPAGVVEPYCRPCEVIMNLAQLGDQFEVLKVLQDRTTNEHVRVPCR